MSNNNDFPGMPDALGAFIVCSLGVILAVSIIGIPLLMLIDAAPRSLAARITLRVIGILTILFIAFIAVFIYLVLNQPPLPDYPA